LQRVADFVGRLVNKVKEITGIAASERAKAEIDARDALAQREDDAQKAAAEAEKNRQQEAQQAAEQRARERAQERERIRREQEQQAEEERKRREERNDEARFDAARVGNQVAEDQKQRIADTNVVVKGGADERLKVLGEEFAKQREQSRKAAEEKLILDQYQIDSENAKRMALYATGDAINEIANIVGKQTAAGKVLAVAQALINTYLGITQVLANKTTLPEPAGTIQKVASVVAISAAGFNAVRNIGKTQVPGGGGGGNIPSNAAAPLLPQTPSVGVTRLDAQTVNNLGNKAVRAYVLETDITDQQTRQRRIERAAVLGG
jgi:hypothetical protein